jgi:hypothetical protein
MTVTKSPSPSRDAATRSGAARSGLAKPTDVTPQQRYQMIAEAAYFLAERRGFAGGDPAQDWLEAEAEIDRILQAGAGGGHTSKEAFQAALELQLRDIDARLEEMKLKASLAKLELRDEYEKQLQSLTAKRVAAQAKLNDLRQRAEGAWEDLRGATEKAWQDMRDTLERLATRFK